MRSQSLIFKLLFVCALTVLVGCGADTEQSDPFADFIEDDDGGSSTGPNYEPEVEVTCATKIDHDTIFSCTPTVSDLNSGDSHSWSLGPSTDCTWVIIDTSTGEVTGYANDDQVGTCTLGFEADDGNGGVDEATATVTVDNVTPTLSIDDADNINEDDPATVIRADAEVQSNEETYGVYSFDHASTTAPACNDNGTLSIDADNGEVTYTPAAGYFGTCNVMVMFDDENGATVSDEFAVTVIQANDPPVINASCATTGTQDIAYACAPGIVDPDGAAPTWSLDASNDCGWAIINGSTGAISGTPNDDEVGTCTLAFLANDTFNDSNVLNFSVTINNVAPTLTIADAANITEDDAAAVIHADANVQANEEGFGTYSFDHATTSGTKCDDNKTSLSIDAGNGEVTYGPSADFNGICNIKVVFDDGNGASVSDEFSITVDPANDPPVISESCATTVSQDVAYTSCTPGISDSDGGAPTWSFDASNDCAWAAINASTGELTGTPNDDDVGTCTLAFKANDGTDDSNILSVSVTVNNVAPLMTIADAADIVKDAAATEIRADADVQADEETFGTYSFDHATTTGTKCDDNKTSLTVDANSGAVTYQPAASYSGTCNIKVRFDDGNGAFVADEFAITVLDNVAPIISGSCATTGTQDVAYTPCNPGVVDPDPDTQTWSFDATNDCAWAAINSSNGQVTGTPTDDDVGNCTLAFVSNDGSVDSNILSFSVTINNVTPTLTIADAADIPEDNPATDIRGDADVQSDEEGFGTYGFDHATTTAPKCDDNKTSLSVNAANGVVNFAPAANYTGTCNIKVAFDDGNGGTVSDEFAITVTAQNDPPVITESCATTGTQDVAYTSCTPGISDPDGGTATWALDGTNTCTWAAINSSTGEITGTPDDDQVGACTLAFKANDTIADSNILSVAVTINNVAPTMTIADAADILTDDPLTEIRGNADVQADEEGFGTYGFDHATTTAPKCDDNKVSLTIDANTGAVSYQPAASYAGTCNIKVFFDDGNAGGTVSDEFAITVVDNVVPIISGSCSTTGTQDVAYTTCNPGVVDPDPDTQTWSFDASHTCTWAAINSSSGQVTGTPDDNDVGNCTLAFKSNDGISDSNVLSFSVNIANVNPTMTIADTSVNEDPGAAVIRFDADVQADEEGFGTYVLNDTTTSGTLCDDNGTVMVNASNGAVTYTPTLNYNGSCNITVEFDDGNGGTVTDEFAVTVNAVDDDPTISDIANKTTPVDTVAKFIFFTGDEGGGTDEDSQTLTVTSITSSNQTVVPNANITNTWTDNGDGGNGEITITPASGQSGVVTITVTLSDGTNTVQDQFDLDVYVAVSPPVAYNVNATTSADTAVGISLLADDIPGGHTITGWTVVTQPENGVLSGTAPNLTYTPNAGFSGRDEFTYTADDSGGETSNVAVASLVVDGKALFVVGNTTLPTGDQQAYDRIQSLGFTVDLADDNNCSVATNCDGFDANDYDMIMVSASTLSGNIGTGLTNVAVPIFTWERFLYDELDMIDTSAGTDSGTITTTQLVIVDDTHPLAGSLSNGTYTVFTANQAMVWGVPTASATIVAEDTTGRAVLFVYETGDAMYHSATAPAKRVGYFLPNAGVGLMSADGLILFDAAVNETLSR